MPDGLAITWDQLEDFAAYEWRTPGGWFCPNKPDGAAQWHHDRGHLRALHYICPCGCKQWRSILIEPYGKGWMWDGDEQRPTLKPSIEHRKAEGSANCGWHGHLTKGVWAPC